MAHKSVHPVYTKVYTIGHARNVYNMYTRTGLFMSAFNARFEVKMIQGRPQVQPIGEILRWLSSS